MELKLDLSAFLSKTIILVIFAIAGGMYFYNNELDDIKKGKELTLEKYTSEYEAYRQDLMDNEPSSAGVTISIVFVFMGTLLVLYELIAWLLSGILKAAFKTFGNHNDVNDPMR